MRAIFRVRQLTVRPVDQDAQLPGVDEEGLPAPVAERLAAARRPARLVAGQEPEARRDRGAVKELCRERHHAVDDVRLDKVLADVPFA